MENGSEAGEERILEDIAVQLQMFGKERDNLIPILQMIQVRHAYLPDQALKMVADRLELSPGEVFGVATFYNQFRFNPPGKHPIQICMGTACHVKGGDIILENFERKLDIRVGQTTPDREFSLDRVACVGCCALAPVAVVDETVHGQMAPSRVEGIMLGFRIEKDRAEKRDEQER